MLVYVIILSGCLYHISTESCLGHEEESLLSGIKSALQTLETRLKAKSLRCPMGWKEYAHHCYNFISTKVAWNEAERECRILGGYLAKVDDEIENNWLKQQASGLGRSFWIGAANFTDDWKWIVDFSNMTFTDWNYWQPDNGWGNEECVVLDKSFRYRWNDEQCSKQIGYICESQKGGACIPYSKLFRK